ncbi:MAG: hypothetical protein ABIN96_12370 [Rubrivivax sp.]
MAALIGWGLAAAAVVAAWAGYGSRGLLLALTVVAFWLLLQFSRALRALRAATGRPVGEVPNAVMLNARLARGMQLSQVLRLTRSLGRAVGDLHHPVRASANDVADEAFDWTDPGGDTVRVALRQGRVTSWQLLRAASRPGAT